tara:strand:+ start:199 stop:483 length:285 start_codon:yes stop_codon:yes gene_type:complete
MLKAVCEGCFFLFKGDLMPHYSFENRETHEQFDQILSMAERETYLEENPHIKQIFKRFPGIVDSVRIGVTKPDAGFRDVLNKAKVHKHNTINSF